MTMCSTIYEWSATPVSIRQRYLFDFQRILRDSQQEIAEVMGGKNVTPTEDIVETPQDKQALDTARKIRKSFNFGMINLKPGTILQFVKDNTITCEVYDDTKVKFRDKITSLSNAADIIMKEMGYDWASVQGPVWWSYNGKSMSELRREYE